MIKRILLSIQISLLFFSCHRNDLNHGTNESQIFGAIFNDWYAITLSKVLISIADNSILAAYEELENDASELYAVSLSYQQNPTIERLSIVRYQWQKVKSSVKRIEVIGFGPASLPLDYLVNIDYYPRFSLDTSKLENEELSTSNTHNLTITRVKGYGVIKRGIAAIEYLLFDNGNGFSDVTSVNSAMNTNIRRIQYLVATTGDLKNRTSDFNLEWKPSGNNYRNDFVLGTNTFSSQKQVLDEIVNQVIFLLSLLIDSKLGEPAGLSAKSGGRIDLNKLESRWSDHSLEDIESNIEGIKILYFGNYKVKEGAPSFGLNHYVNAINPSLDLKINQQLKTIEEEIRNIRSESGTLRIAISQNLNSVSKLYSAIRTLRTTCSTELIVTLGTTIGVSSNDGD